MKTALVGADTSRTLLHAFELLALLPHLGGRRSLRLGALRLLTASLGRGDFGGDFFYGYRHGSGFVEAEFRAWCASPADIGAQTGGAFERRLASYSKARVAIGGKRRGLDLRQQSRSVEPRRGRAGSCRHAQSGKRAFGGRETRQARDPRTGAD